MKIYPSLVEEFNSPLLPSELLARVQNNTSNRIFEWRDEPFQGEVGEISFAIKRIRWFNNVANRPNINGWVEMLSDGKGSKLKLRHHIWPLGFWFGIIILFIICAFGLLIAVSLVIDDGVGPVILLLPPSLFALGFYSITGPFWREVRSSRDFLIRLLLLEKQCVS